MNREYPLYNVDQYDDFRAYINGIGEKFADNTAICMYDYYGQERSYTYRQLLNDVNAMTQALISDGYGGKHIAIVSPNSYYYLVAFFAITASGGTAVLIDVEQPVSMINEHTEYADCTAILASDDRAEYLSNTAKKPVVIISNNENETSDYLEKGHALIAEGKDDYKNVKLLPESTAAIVYTSGTTHTAKAVMLSHYALLHNASDSVSLVYIPRRVFVSLPFFHTYGLTCAILNSLINGACICINGDIKFMQRDLLKFNPQSLLAVPLIAEMLYKVFMKDIDKFCNPEKLTCEKTSFFSSEIKPIPAAVKKKNTILPALELIICGGAHLSEKVARALTRFGILVLQGYGITECSPLISVNRNKQNVIGSVGYKLPSYELKIDNGIIKVKGKCLMTGYYKNPELTAEAITDGWFDTGDLGYFGKHGELYIKGRNKNIIVLKNGKKVSPEELEAKFDDVPIVKGVVAYGSATGSEADEVMPAISVYPDPELTKDMASYEILEVLQKEVDKINDKLPLYKQIRIINIRETDFEKTSTKKIKRTL